MADTQSATRDDQRTSTHSKSDQIKSIIKELSLTTREVEILPVNLTPLESPAGGGGKICCWNALEMTCYCGACSYHVVK